MTAQIGSLASHVLVSTVLEVRGTQWAAQTPGVVPQVVTHCMTPVGAHAGLLTAVAEREVGQAKGT